MEEKSFLSDADRTFAGETVERMQQKLVRVADRCRGTIPYTTGSDGRYDDRSMIDRDKKDWGNGLAWWTNGFWAGLLWQLFARNGDDQFLTDARQVEETMDACFLHYYGLHHDVGFMWMPMAVADWRITGNADSLRRGLLAAQLLAGRFNPAGRFIRAWNEVGDEDTRGWAIIDCMINLSLLYWASEQTGDPRFREIAQAHADTVASEFIRADGSSCHIVEFDPESGRKKRALAGQGYSEESAWTRGQAWAIYGFAISYRHTGKRLYLDQAMRVADFFVAHIPESGLIPVDFLQPGDVDFEDSCGAAAAASGLLELAGQIADLSAEESGESREDEVLWDKAQVYTSAALRILRSLASKRADWSDASDAVLTHCSPAYRAASHNMTMVYADYYFFEALLKITGEGVFLW